jgi:hypothetical protein
MYSTATRMCVRVLKLQVAAIDMRKYGGGSGKNGDKRFVKADILFYLANKYILLMKIVKYLI